MREKYAFDRPVIILAAPRSGSTLLFETLSESDDFWTIGGESHGMFESINRFNPLLGYCDSNALSADDATPKIIEQIRLRFLEQLRDARGRSFESVAGSAGLRPRLLEKTPKNSLRVSLLNEIFPDAFFIYLYRNPRENISSIMDAWESGRFVTYSSLLGRDGSWSLLLPSGWQSYNNASLEDTAAFQWQSANTAIVRELGKLDRSRWMAVSFGQQVRKAAETVRSICEFCDVSPDAILDSATTREPRLSRYTLTPPADDKWHKNAAALSRVLPGLRETLDDIRELATDLPDDEFELSVDPALPGELPASEVSPAVGVDLKPPNRRNDRCPCGSGKKYKHCHGNLSRQGVKK